MVENLDRINKIYMISWFGLKGDDWSATVSVADVKSKRDACAPVYFGFLKAVCLQSCKSCLSFFGFCNN